MLRALLVCSALVIGWAAVAAEPITITYVEGLLEVGDDSEWSEAGIGDEVDAESVLRVSDDGLVELSYEGLTVVLRRDGTYRVTDLISSAREVSAWNLGDLIGSKLAKIAGDEEVKEGTAGGVRGADVGSESFTWMGDTAEEARLAFEEKRYEETIALVESTVDFEVEETQAELRFYAGSAYAELGRFGLAVQLLIESNPGPDAEYFDDYVLLLGRLFIESLSFEDGLRLFDRYLQAFPDGDSAQIVHLLAAYGYRGLGDESAARAELAEAVRLDTDTAAADHARHMLEAAR